MHVMLVLKETTMHERMGVMHLSSALKQQGHSVALVMAKSHSKKQLFKIIQETKPKIVGYSAMTGEFPYLSKLNDEIKKNFNIISVFGGPHSTFFNDCIDEQNIDAICIGEGDASFPEFCNRVENAANFWEVQGLHVRHEGKIYRNNNNYLISDLDKVPFPDREIMYKADPRLRFESSKIFFSSRGCPYKCTYCFNIKYNQMFSDYGKIVRYRSVENVIEEIYLVKSQHYIQRIYFDDDVFTLKPVSWFEHFAHLYKNRIGLPFTCNVRANNLREEVLLCLKEAGLDAVGIGIECGNEHLANSVLGRGVSNEELISACELLRKHGIKIVTANLNGLPVPHPYNVDIETLDLNIKIKPDFAWSSIIYPYPGTPIKEFAESHGFLREKTTDLETNKKHSIFEFASPLEKRRVENLHKLFGVIVEFPMLRQHVDTLCSLPLASLYTFIFYAWYGYCAKFRIYPFTSARKEIWKYIIYFLKLLTKS